MPGRSKSNGIVHPGKRSAKRTHRSSMQLLTQFIDPVDAAAVKARLVDAGIMVKSKSVDPHIIQPSKSGSQRIGLWIVFDDQFDDAVQLLQDPDHVPQRVISRDKMRALESSVTKPANSRLLIIGIAAGMLGFILYLTIKALE
jgi:hypothetical protein